MKKIIAIVHNAVTKDSPPDERDVLDQVAAVSDALRGIGHEPVPVPCDLNLERLKFGLAAIGPDGVFNLVESLDGQGRLIHVIPYLLDGLGIPYAGCPADAVFLTSHKTAAKERMREAGLPTPDWIGPYHAGTGMPRTRSFRKAAVQSGHREAGGPWIVKSLWEHGSIGLEKENIITGSLDDVTDRLIEAAGKLGGACFAEAFIHGREFNLSLLENEKEVQVLPPAEIRFTGFPEDTPRIVGYRAKWQSESFEYNHTPRSFDFSETDHELLSRLESIAVSCWGCFSLSGYARVDFRIDHRGNPYILEINANPCLSPDAGFAASLGRAGISYGDAIERIVAPVLQTGR